MNFLAHALLSGSSPTLTLGNVCADFIKGRARQAFPAEVRLGFTLHQRIDIFTDTHPAVAAASELIAPQWGRYSPVLIDIYFDHLLAADFPHHHRQSLRSFADAIYALLRHYQALLPERARLATSHMIRHDWLAGYATTEGLAQTFAGLTRRLKHGINLTPAVDTLTAVRQPIAEHFAVFWPQLQSAAAATRLELAAPGL